MIRNGSVVVAVAAVAHCRPKLPFILMPEKIGAAALDHSVEAKSVKNFL
ncbi:hypothetical protein SAMCCGM7_Ch3520 [Sinorhizobium americanum CCGM7]|nr:hypothetical protein SAMCCGM7_Ch3520 [Sinorhizobium americanum CCGM7]